jgi:hypothetical protein
MTSCDHDKCVEAGLLLVRRYILDQRRETEDMWPETIAAINAAPVEVGRYLQRHLGCGPLMRNAAHCLVCDTIVESRTRHDFRSCKCGNVSVDGGTWYARRLGGEKGEVTQIIEEWPWVVDNE